MDHGGEDISPKVAEHLAVVRKMKARDNGGEWDFARAWGAGVIECLVSPSSTSRLDRIPYIMPTLLFDQGVCHNPRLDKVSTLPVTLTRPWWFEIGTSESLSSLHSLA